MKCGWSLVFIVNIKVFIFVLAMGQNKSCESSACKISHYSTIKRSSASNEIISIQPWTVPSFHFFLKIYWVTAYKKFTKCYFESLKNYICI